MVTALRTTDEHTAATRWGACLRTFPACDGFSAILDPTIRNLIFKPPEPRTFDVWISRMESWLRQTRDPSKQHPFSSVVLRVLWEHFTRDVTDNLRLAKVTSEIPSQGGILAVVGGIEKCVVLSYSFIGITPLLRVIAVVDHPRSLFDFWSVIDTANPAARNVLKSILASGHKLVYHRGVLVHVNRQLDAHVFGPSIDTLVMSELIARTVVEPKIGPKTVLEIGCGSGFLSALVARHVDTLQELVCVDIDYQSIACTKRNIETVRHKPGVRPFNVSYIARSFEPDVVGRQKFDLIICNPPYIPRPPAYDGSARPDAAFLHAVSGLDLLETVLKSAHKMLSRHGRMLLVVSDLSIKGAKSLVDNRFAVEYPFGENGYDVLFDVEDVLNDRMWMDFLRKHCGLKKPRYGVYTHKLFPFWLTRRNH